MKIQTVASVCAGIALIASIVAVSSWMELRKQREVNAASRERQVEVPLPAVPPPTATVAAATPPGTPIRKIESSTSSPAKKNDADELVKQIFDPEYRRALMRDPNSRKALHNQVSAGLGRDYPDLARELGLSQDEAERLFDLLANAKFARMEEFTNRGDQEVDATEVQRRKLESDRQLEESVRVQLGDKYPQWQVYQQTRPARAQAASLSEQLTRAGMPLSAEQYKSITTAWIADSQRQAESRTSMPQDPSVNTADPEYRARREENIRRKLDAAAPYVDANQLAVMRDVMGQESLYEMVRRKPAQVPQAPAQ